MEPKASESKRRNNLMLSLSDLINFEMSFSAITKIFNLHFTITAGLVKCLKQYLDKDVVGSVRVRRLERACEKTAVHLMTEVTSARFFCLQKRREGALNCLPRKYERHEREKCLKSPTVSRWLFDDDVLREVQADTAKNTSDRLSDEALHRKPQRIIVQCQGNTSRGYNRGGFQSSSSRSRGRPSFPTRGRGFDTRRGTSRPTPSVTPASSNPNVSSSSRSNPQVRPQTARGKKKVPFRP